MGRIHLRSRTARFHPILTLVTLGFCTAAAASAQRIDGLSTTWVGELIAGEKGRLAVSWTGTPGAELTVWVDFDGDGIFDTAENVVEKAELEEGIEIFEVDVPVGTVIDERTRTRLRFREDGEIAGQELVLPVLGGKDAGGCAWASEFHARGMNETVWASATFDDGSGPALYVGGGFTSADDVIVNYIAKWDGASWAPLGTGLDSSVSALTVYDDGSGPALYAGGSFSTAGGVNANKIAKWDGASWTPLSTGMDSSVFALTVYDDGSGPALYAGGVFLTAGGVNANKIAKWDGASWTPLSTGMNSSVYALAVYDDGSGPALYAGGKFLTAGGVNAKHIAKWDGASWTPLATGIHGSVRALTVYDDGSGSALYAGEMKWDGASWTPLVTNTGLNHVYALAVYDDGSGPTLYAGGFFYSAGGVRLNHIAKWDGASWTPLGTGMDGRVNELTVYDDGSGPELYAGGDFTTAGGLNASRIAKWNGATWGSVSRVIDCGGMNGWVSALAVWDDGSGPALYADGGFTTGVNDNSVAKWDGTSWTPLGSDMDRGVGEWAVYDDGSGPALYAGGNFSTVGGVHASGIAEWDGVSWTPLDTGMNGSVDALTVYDDGSGPALYVGGIFATPGDHPAVDIAKWDGASWTQLGTGMDGHVAALTVYDDGSGPALYAGGSFTTVGGVLASGIAEWDGVSWTPLGTGVDNSVGALTVYDDGNGPALYAGGHFYTAGGVIALHIARWDGVSWTPLSSGVDYFVGALTVYDDGNGPALYAGGDFTTAGGKSAPYIARWDGVSWTPLGTGMGTGRGIEVNTLTVYDDGSGPALYAGGYFSTAGGIPSANIAKWSCPTAPSSDLAITKTNGVSEAIADTMTTYTIVATNPSPVYAPTATLTDTFPPELTCSWTSSTTGGAFGNTTGSGPALEDTLSMPAGSSVTYTIACRIAPDATGELTNTATIAAPDDPDLADNVAIDTDVIVQPSDLEVTLANGTGHVIAGGTLTYGLVVTNHGPDEAGLATLTDDFPAELTGCRWQSTADGGASGHTSGMGAALNDTLAMPAGSSVSYIVTCAVPATASGTLTHEATVTSSTDLNSVNNTATATNPVITRPAVKTVILTHFQRMHAEMDLTAADLEELLARLHAFASHPSVEGLVIDVGYAADLAELYAHWDADVADGFSDPDLANLVLFGCRPPFCGAEKQGLHDILREKLETHLEASYLVLVGDDRIFPMARIRDFTDTTIEVDYTPLGLLSPGLTATNTTVGQALAEGRYLSDDPLAVRGPIARENLDRFSTFLPDLAVGRLVETPAEILHSLDVFLGQDGLLDLTQLDPDHRVLVTGYDFLIDSARRVRQRWKSAFGLPQPHPPGDLVPVDGRLVSRTWDLVTVGERREALLDHLSGHGLGRYGIMNLNGHATHYEEGVPGENFTDIHGLRTSAIDTLDLTGSVIYAVGCHGGLPVAGREATADDHPLDLPQTFLRRGAMAYVANSGFGWGLLDAIGYSERMVEMLTEELTQGGEITIGDAVRTAKERYYLENVNFDAYDIKTSMQWTLFGFPMAAIHTGIGAAADAAVNADAVTVRSRRLSRSGGAPSHLIAKEKNFSLTSAGLYTKYTATGEAVPAGVAGCPAPAGGEPAGCYYTLIGLATGEGDLPIGPFFSKDSRLSGTSQHGVLWKGGGYEEEAGWTPVFAQPASNGGPIAIPDSLPLKTFIRPRGRFRQDSLADPSECRPTDTDFNSIVFSPAELVFDEQREPTIHRLHRQVDLEVLYYNNTEDGTGNCDRTGPRFGDGPYHAIRGTRVYWSVPARDEGGVWRVVVVYDDEVHDRWVPLELAYEASTDRWQGWLRLPEGMSRLTYFLQAVDNRGNVSWVEFTPSEPPASGIDSELPLLLEASPARRDTLIFADGFERGDCSMWSRCP